MESIANVIEWGIETLWRKEGHISEVRDPMSSTYTIPLPNSPSDLILKIENKEEWKT